MHVCLTHLSQEVLAGDTVIAAGELPELPSSAPAPRAVVPATSDAMDASPLPDEVALPDDDELTAAASAATTALSENMLERAKYVPMRLSLAERKVLRLVEAGLRVSEYTDKIDILTYTSKTKRIHAQIKEICAILCGLTVASDYQRGQELMQERDFAPNESFFQVRSRTSLTICFFLFFFEFSVVWCFCRRSVCLVFGRSWMSQVVICHYFFSFHPFLTDFLCRPSLRSHAATRSSTPKRCVPSTAR